MEDKYYLAALLQCRQIGSVRMRRLCAAVSEAQEIWAMSAAALRATGILSDALADDLARHIQAQKRDTIGLAEPTTEVRCEQCNRRTKRNRGNSGAPE